MDREHPIPQEVSTYEFRLVGDMTIKQFMQVAAGALIALLLYSTNIAPYVKWPLIVISFMSGIALAFFPIQDRPLSKWIILFVKAIYSPTVYVWDKNAKEHQYFAAEDTNIGTAPGVMLNSQQVSAPLPAVAAVDNEPGVMEENKLDQTEEAFLEKLDSQFSVSPIQNTGGTQVQSENQNSQQSSVTVPKTEGVQVEGGETPNQSQAPETQQTSQVGSELTPQYGQPDPSAKAAIFSPDASPPSPPTNPNVVVGQVLDSEGKIVDGAILEILDSNGRSVRALRSNNLGHFMIVTPLVNGNYKITVEKDGFEFEPVTFEAKDRIIPPIAIWAKGKEEKAEQNNQEEQVVPDEIAEDLPAQTEPATTMQSKTASFDVNTGDISTDTTSNNDAILIKPVTQEISDNEEENKVDQNPSGNLYNADDQNKNQNF